MQINQRSLAPLSAPITMERFAYDAIKEAILTFHFLPGENLVESVLASQLKTSKTPVRDALTQLVREGFIEKVPFKGYTVTQVSRQDMIDIFDVRSMLEGMAARRAAERMTPGEIREAEELVERHTQAMAGNNNELASQTNRQFHQLLIRSGGSERISQILENLDDHQQRYRLLSNISIGRLAKSAEEHMQIMQAIKNRDADAAEEAVRRHLLSVSKDLAEQDFDLLIRKVSGHQQKIG